MLWFLAGCVGNLAVECADVCPQGSALAAENNRMDSFEVVEDSCTATCDPIQPCLAPNVPVFQGSGDSLSFECRVQDGFGTLTRPDDIDTDFGEGWVAIAAQTVLPGETLPADIIDLGVLPGGEVYPMEWLPSEPHPEFFVDAFVDANDWWLAVDGGGFASTEYLGGTRFYVSTSSAAYARPQMLVDIDGDSNSDYLFSGLNDWVVCYGDGTGAAVEPCVEQSAGISSLVLMYAADGDNDSDEDLLVVDSDSVVYFVENEAGILLAPRALSASFTYLSTQVDTYWTTTEGDVNDDGYIDLLIWDTVLLGGPDGWDESLTIAGLTSLAGSGAIVDENGDGFDEVLAYKEVSSLGLVLGVFEYDNTTNSFAQTREVQSAIENSRYPGQCRRVDWYGDGQEGLVCDRGRIVAHVDGVLADVMGTSDGGTWGAGSRVGFVAKFSDGPAYVGFEYGTGDGYETSAFRSSP